MGQFGEKLVRRPQGGNKPGICKEQIHTKGWYGLNVEDPIGEYLLWIISGRAQILGLCKPSKEFEFYPKCTENN